jgi:CBS domain-containing protein
MSPRAAWRLESLGFGRVYDYAAGKLDWLGAGLPIEGRFEGWPTAGTVARKDIPTCRLDEPMGEVRARVKEAGWEACVVVNEERVVLGLLRAGELEAPVDRTAGLEAPAGRTAEQAMRPGPSTFRPHVPIREMAKFMGEHHLESSPVTTSDGRLVGLLRREDAERAAAEFHRAMHHHEEDDDAGA